MSQPSKQIGDPVKDLSEIRSMMERSSKFLSLSGMAGISAGAVALAGAAAAFRELGRPEGQNREPSLLGFFLCDAGAVLILALGCAIFFTTRMAKKKNLPVWSGTAQSMLVSLLIPLAAGGLFCSILWFHGLVFLIGPATLIFYGLALFNCSKYTLREVQLLAAAETLLGLAAALYLDAWLFFWAFGFGVLHIVYGIGMYLKYEK